MGLFLVVLAMHVALSPTPPIQFCFGVSQTCLGANVLSGLVPSTVFQKNLWAFLGPCVRGMGAPPVTVPLHNLRVASHVLYQEVPLGWYRVRLF